MTQPERHLRAVTHVYDEQTGEVIPDATAGELCQNPACVDLRDAAERFNANMAAERAAATRAINELRRVTGVDPKAEQIQQAATYWQDAMVREGWWGQRPKVTPGDNRWQRILWALKAGYDVRYLCTAVDGQVEEARRRRDRGFQRRWLDLDSLLRNRSNVEAAYERAQDPRNRRVSRGDLPAELADQDFDMLRTLFVPCGCGHPRVHHAPAWGDGREPCRHPDCGCRDFDDLDWRAAEFVRRETEREKRGART